MNSAVQRELVLLPGWSLSSNIFAGEFLQYLRAHFRVTELELPRAKTLADTAQLALAAAPEHAVWCGFSLGGMVATQAALLQPGRVSALLLLATSPSFVAKPDWPNGMPAAEFAAFSASLDAACAAGSKEDLAAVLARFDALQCSGGSTARADLRMLRGLREGAGPGKAARDVSGDVTVDALGEAWRNALKDGLAVLRDSDLHAGIASITCPSAWLFGAQDALVPAAVAGDIRARLPAARVTVLDDANHLVWRRYAMRVVHELNALMAEIS